MMQTFERLYESTMLKSSFEEIEGAMHSNFDRAENFFNKYKMSKADRRELSQIMAALFSLGIDLGEQDPTNEMREDFAFKLRGYTGF